MKRKIYSCKLEQVKELNFTGMNTVGIDVVNLTNEDNEVLFTITNNILKELIADTKYLPSEVPIVLGTINNIKGLSANLVDYGTDISILLVINGVSYGGSSIKEVKKYFNIVDKVFLHEEEI